MITLVKTMQTSKGLISIIRHRGRYYADYNSFVQDYIKAGHIKVTYLTKKELSKFENTLTWNKNLIYTREGRTFSTVVCYIGKELDLMEWLANNKF